MGWIVLSNSGKTNYNIKEYVCDSLEDLPIDTREASLGSTAYVTSEQKTYMLNSQKEWVEVKSSGGGGEGGDSGIPLNPTPQTIFRNDDITPDGWVATDGTSLKLVGGTYQTDGKCLVCNGSRLAIQRENSSYVLWGIKCSVNSDFVPSSDTRWWMASCIMGQELSGAQRDYACIVTNDGYFGLGWSTQSITKSSVYALDGKVHEIFMFATDAYVALIIDGKVECIEFMKMSGGQMNQMGIFWNSSNNNSITKGRVYSIGCWNYNMDGIKFSGIPKLA